MKNNDAMDKLAKMNDKLNAENLRLNRRLKGLNKQLDTSEDSFLETSNELNRLKIQYKQVNEECGSFATAFSEANKLNASKNEVISSYSIELGKAQERVQTLKNISIFLLLTSLALFVWGILR